MSLQHAKNNSYHFIIYIKSYINFPFFLLFFCIWLSSRSNWFTNSSHHPHQDAFPLILNILEKVRTLLFNSNIDRQPFGFVNLIKNLLCPTEFLLTLIASLLNWMAFSGCETHLLLSFLMPNQSLPGCKCWEWHVYPSFCWCLTTWVLNCWRKKTSDIQVINILWSLPLTNINYLYNSSLSSLWYLQFGVRSFFQLKQGEIPLNFRQDLIKWMLGGQVGCKTWLWITIFYWSY